MLIVLLIIRRGKSASLLFRVFLMWWRRTVIRLEFGRFWIIDTSIIAPRCLLLWTTRAVAAIVADIRGVFGTLTYPHLILSYSAYIGHLASHYGGP